jgi:hypothetical protein
VFIDAGLVAAVPPPLFATRLLASAKRVRVTVPITGLPAAALSGIAPIVTPLVTAIPPAAKFGHGEVAPVRVAKGIRSAVERSKDIYASAKVCCMIHCLGARIFMESLRSTSPITVRMDREIIASIRRNPLLWDRSLQIGILSEDFMKCRDDI